VPKIAQPVRAPTNGQATALVQPPTIFEYSGNGLMNTPPFNIDSSPWILKFSTNWSGHFAVQLRNGAIELLINRSVTAGREYETYVYRHTGSNLYFSIKNAPRDGIWVLAVIKVT